MKKREGFSLIEILIVITISSGLFLATRTMISSYTLQNELGKMANNSIAMFHTGWLKGKQYSMACFFIENDPDLKKNTRSYETTCSSSGRDLTLTVKGINLLKGIKYSLSSNNSPGISTTISYPITQKFGLSTDQTIPDCIVSDFDMHCAQGKKSTYVPTT